MTIMIEGWMIDGEIEEVGKVIIVVRDVRIELSAPIHHPKTVGIARLENLHRVQVCSCGIKDLVLSYELVPAIQR